MHRLADGTLRLLGRFLPLALAALSATGCASRAFTAADGSRGAGALQGYSLAARPLSARGAGPERDKLQVDLAAALAARDAAPNDPDAWIWVGRRQGYLWEMRAAIDTYTHALERWPDDAPLYRHRGHRYLSLREFERAAADLETAARLIEGRPDVVEADGQPNVQNVPLTSLAFNVWYHLGVTRYCQGEFPAARDAFERCCSFLRGYDDNKVAVYDWLYLTRRRLGEHDAAAELLTEITPEMQIIENAAYHRRLLMYKGVLPPEALLRADDASDLDFATNGFGVGCWKLLHGDAAAARAIFERVTAGPMWPAFGFIAAEAELARLPTLH